MKRELEVLDEKYGVRGCFEVLSVSGVYLAKLARDPVSASRNFGLCATTAFPLPKIAVCSEDVFPDQVPSLLPLFLFLSVRRAIYKTHFQSHSALSVSADKAISTKGG